MAKITPQQLRSKAADIAADSDYGNQTDKASTYFADSSSDTVTYVATIMHTESGSFLKELLPSADYNILVAEGLLDASQNNTIVFDVNIHGAPDDVEVVTHTITGAGQFINNGDGGEDAIVAGAVYELIGEKLEEFSPNALSLSSNPLSIRANSSAPEAMQITDEYIKWGNGPVKGSSGTTKHYLCGTLHSDANNTSNSSKIFIQVYGGAWGSDAIGITEISAGTRGGYRASKFTKLGSTSEGSKWDLRFYQSGTGPDSIKVIVETDGVNYPSYVVRAYTLAENNSSEDRLKERIIQDVNVSGWNDVTNNFAINDWYSTSPIQSWQSVTYQNGWTTYSGSYNAAGYYKDRDRVYICGLVKSGTIASAIFTLPAGYRPSKHHIYTQLCLGNIPIRLDVKTDGQVIPQTGVNGWVSLEGISFRV